MGFDVGEENKGTLTDGWAVTFPPSIFYLPISFFNFPQLFVKRASLKSSFNVSAVAKEAMRKVNELTNAKAATRVNRLIRILNSFICSSLMNFESYN